MIWTELRLLNFFPALLYAGLRVKYDLRKPVGQRVASVDAMCTRCEVPHFEPLQDERIYKMIVSSFVAGGGDGYAVIRDNIIQHDLLGKYYLLGEQDPPSRQDLLD